MKQALVLAIDGGGTKCKGALYDHSGKIIGEGLSGPANIFRDLSVAQQSIEACANACLTQAQKQHSAFKDIRLADLHLSAGCAGAGIKEAVIGFDAWQHPFAKAWLTTDLHVSCLAANEGKDCGLVIVGTGSAIAKFEKGQLRQYGGHGFVLGDQAGGAWLGRQAIQWYLAYADNVLPRSSQAQGILTQHQMGKEGLNNTLHVPCKHASQFAKALHAQLLTKDSAQIVQLFSHASADAFAALAPLIWDLADNGNLTAKAFIDIGLDYLSQVLSNNGIDQLDKIFITGGMSARYLPLLQAQLRANNSADLQLMDRFAEHGAYLFALNQLAANC